MIEYNKHTWQQGELITESNMNHIENGIQNLSDTLTDGTQGQIFQLNSEGKPEWNDVGTPSDTQVGNAVNTWLNAHPEASTTVQDGAITYAKLDANLKAYRDGLTYTETTSIASRTHIKGTYFVYNGALYEAITDIASGDDIITTGDEYNCRVVDISKEFSVAESDIFYSEYLINNGEYNLTETDFVSGYWNYSTPATNRKDRIRTRYLIPVRARTEIKYSNPTMKVFFGVLKTPWATSNGYLQTSDWVQPGNLTKVYNILYDGWLTVIIENTGADIPPRQEYNPENDMVPSDYDCTISIRTFIGNALNNSIKTIQSIPERNLLLSNIYPRDSLKENSDTNAYLTFKWNEDGTECVVNGTNDSSTAINYFYGSNTSLQQDIIPGETYHVKIKTEDTNIKLYFHFYKDEGTYLNTVIFTQDGELTIPDLATGMYGLIAVAANASVSNKKIYDFGLYKTIAVDINQFNTDHSTLENLSYTTNIYESLTNNGKYTIKISDLESGGWNVSDTLFVYKTNNLTRIRNKYLIPVRAGMKIAYSNITFDIYYAVAETPTSISYIEGNSWRSDGKGVININHDGWLVFLARDHTSVGSVNIDPINFDSIVTIETPVDKIIKTVNLLSEKNLLMPNVHPVSNTVDNVNFTWNEDKTECIVDGTNTGNGVAANYFYGAPGSIPSQFKVGETYHVKVKTEDTNAKLYFYFYKNGSYDTGVSFTQDGDITIPATATGMLVLIGVPKNASISEAKVWDIGVYEKISVDIGQYNEDISRIDDTSANLSSAEKIYESLINNGQYVIKIDDLESGSWFGSSKISNTSRIRIKYLIPVLDGMKVSYISPNYDIYLNIVEATETQAWQTTTNWFTVSRRGFNIKGNGYLALVIRKHGDDSAVIAPTDFDGTIIIETASGLRVSDNRIKFDEHFINDGEYTITVSDLESGQWSYYYKTQSTTRACTKYLIPVCKGMKIYYSNTTFDTFFGLLETPTSDAYIPQSGSDWYSGNDIFEINFDGWLTFVIRNHNNTTQEIDPTDYDSVVTIKTALKQAIDALTQ